MRLCAYWDMSWATRPRGESQGCYLVFVIEGKHIGDGRPTPQVATELPSAKLTRVSRGSSGSEAQSAATAVDSLEWRKTVSGLAFRPEWKPLSQEAMRMFGRSPCVTDCRVLFDVAPSVSSGRGLPERRTSIDIQMANEQVTELHRVWRWPDSYQHLRTG